MTYQESISFLFSQLPMFQSVGGSAYKPGLERVYQLLELCGNPHQGLTTLHVAGTNGKGSTSSMLASVLRASGLKVGLFTSPHLVDFRERIRVNGAMVTEEFVVQFVQQMQPYIPATIEPSFFELTTAMAFAYFQQEGTDIAVIEVGMGGRLDSTNVISPLLSIITNVSIDHSAYLGSTLAQIASEKAGIIKPHTPVVLGRSTPPEVLQVVQERSQALAAPLTLADQSNEIHSYSQLPTHPLQHYTTRHYGSFTSPLIGTHQAENMGTLLAALQQLAAIGYAITPEQLQEGLLRLPETGLRGRLEVVQEAHPRIVIDTGHNPDAWHYLAPQLQAWHQEGGVVILLGMAADKEVEEVLRLLPPTAPLLLTKAAGQRSMPAEELATHARAVGLTNVTTNPTPASAYTQALQLCRTHPASTLFIGGSNFLVGDLLRLFPH